MILAHLYVDGDTSPGLHSFAAIPHRGDQVHLPNGEDVMVLTVERVDHYPVPAKHGASNIFGSVQPTLTVYCRLGMKKRGAKHD